MTPQPTPWLEPFERAMSRDRPNPRVQVATVSPDGLPTLRTVVLRGLLGDGTPWFHTDARSRKVDHLDSERPHLAMLAWFEATQQQFRLTGRGVVHGEGATEPWAAVRRSAWSRLTPENRLPFFGPPPGRRYVEPVEPSSLEAPPQPFVVVALEVDEVDWLRLGPPHQRASFRKVGATWLVQQLTP
ncbi:MAG: pyridoxamine 5'-phosphate oxidase family protein [Myxococcaceae bacterium]|nr:pyridoxamine 5'-phosphate oxidase family protein [Myxococcaceae bacterium]